MLWEQDGRTVEIVFLVAVTGRGLHDGRRLPGHGITVSAEFDHLTKNTRVYRYPDLDARTACRIR